MNNAFLTWKICLLLLSHPLWGAWIEIILSVGYIHYSMSHPLWGAWIEIERSERDSYTDWSHPLWGAWIEMPDLVIVSSPLTVAPLMGCVD